jgi:hypothetical protein
MTHTPGPWRLDGPRYEEVTSHGDNYHVIDAGDPYIVGKPSISGFHLSGFMSTADAQLIAAAPVLLAAAKDVALHYFSPQLYAAIAKAEGRE